MKLSRFLLLVLISVPLLAEQFTITSDVEAVIELDGKPLGTTPLSIQAEPGEHQLVATPKSGGPKWSKLVLVSSSLPNTLAIPLRAHLLKAEIENQGFWKDPRTHLIWSAADNGSGVTVSQAAYYCRQLKDGSWRLPSIDELQSIFGGPSDEHGFRLIAPLRVSGWAWSATEGNEPAEHWTLDFGDGARASVAAGDAGLNRALCVRAAR